MKIGIVVYSQTGNTYKVANLLAERLKKEEQDAILEQVTIVGEPPSNPNDVKLDNIPDVKKYDLIVFGAPVQAFNLAMVMKAYLKQLPELKDKKVACFITKQLSLKWLGGTQAVNKIAKLCETKGASIICREMVVWTAKYREQSINTCLDNLNDSIKAATE